MTPTFIPRQFIPKLILTLISASAVIAAALITTECKRMSTLRRFLFQEQGAILNRQLHVVGPQGFDQMCDAEQVRLPVSSYPEEYEVYDSGKWLGRINNPSGTENEVIVIDIEVPSKYWETTRDR